MKHDVPAFGVDNHFIEWVGQLCPNVQVYYSQLGEAERDLLFQAIRRGMNDQFELIGQKRPGPQHLNLWLKRRMRRTYHVTTKPMGDPDAVVLHGHFLRHLVYCAALALTDKLAAFVEDFGPDAIDYCDLEGGFFDSVDDETMEALGESAEYGESLSDCRGEENGVNTCPQTLGTTMTEGLGEHLGSSAGLIEKCSQIPAVLGTSSNLEQT